MYYDINGKIPSYLIKFLHEAILNAHKKTGMYVYVLHVSPLTTIWGYAMF